MKTKNKISVLSISLLASLLVAAEEAPNPNVHGDPYVPVGRLAVNPTFVATGVKPNLTWDIEYPTTFQDLALVGPSGAIETTQEVQVEVRVLGVSLTDSETRQDLPVALWVRTGGAGSDWEPVFNGTGSDVNPSKVIYKRWINRGTKIDISARGQSPSGNWKEIVWTITPSHSLAHGSNGTPVPDLLSSSAAGEVATFTSAILSNDQSEISIGPKDMAYFFELGSEDPSESAFDLQDLVALVQFKTSNNNGHGNNADGVDVSNPGQEDAGGPNGGIDESGEFDDENKIIAESSGVIEHTIKTSKEVK